ncbi:hypothetical protein SLS62_000001 [Diatrype stigma]|uniref:Uncharacterized protein n=1 Tax=Diatrype stigma TaxID=117547 RepID=A0AAN9YXN9_9PEZI
MRYHCSVLDAGRSSGTKAFAMHTYNDPPCQRKRNDTLLDGFSKAQEQKLRSRKKADKNMTDEDKWREIYLILFPDDDVETIPSPYYGDILFDKGSLEAYRDSPESFIEFARREFPQFVRRELEVLFQTEFRDIGELIRPRIQEMMLMLQPRLT